jgi:putative transposase
MIFLPGPRFTTTSASGSARVAGGTFTTGCATGCAGRQKKTSPTAAILDSQSVKTAEQGGVSGYDAGKKVKGRKRHLLVDTLGLLLGVHVTSAAVQDRDGARELLRQVWFIFGRLQVIWADGGYAGQLLGWVKALRPWGKLHLEIVKRSETAKGFALVRKRWIVERTFAWLYQRRRLVRDYERRIDHSEAFIYIAMIGLMTKRLALAKL